MSGDRGLKNAELLDFLEAIDRELCRRITIVAVGGTAMTLINAKTSTRDVDFTIPSEFYEEFQEGIGMVPHGFDVQCWHDGAVFVNMLPGDYLGRSMTIKTGLKNINPRALHPVDIVVTKIGRLNERDMEDIKSCIKIFGIKKNDIKKRSRQIGAIGAEKSYIGNMYRAIRDNYP